MDLEQMFQPLSCLLGYNGELVPDAQNRGKGDKQQGRSWIELSPGAQAKSWGGDLS